MAPTDAPARVVEMLIDEWTEMNECPACDMDTLVCAFIEEMDPGHTKGMGGDKPNEYFVYCRDAYCENCGHRMDDRDIGDIESRRF